MDDRPTIRRNRPFLFLWASQALTQTAQNAVFYGVVVLVETKTRSSTQLSLALLSLILPSLLFGVLAGVLVDRTDKRLVLLASNVLRGVVVLGYLFFSHDMLLVFALSFLFATLFQFFAPAETAMIPLLVPRRELLQANSLFHLTFTASQLAGLSLLGPLLVKVLGVEVLFVVVAAVMLLSAALVWPLPKGVGAGRVPARGSRALAGVWSDLVEVFALLRRDRVVRLAMIHLTSAATLSLLIAMLAPRFVVDVLGIDAVDTGLIMAPAGAGMVLGSLLLVRMASRVDRRGIVVVGLATVALVLVLLGALPALSTGPSALGATAWRGTVGAASALLPVVMALAFAAGLAFAAIMVASQTTLQERSPVHARGRVFAVQFMLGNAASLVPLVGIGTLTDLVGVPRMLLVLGLAMSVLFVVTVRHRRAPELSEDQPDLDVIPRPSAPGTDSPV
ncbi:MAG TPA: MFS transporter [Chloroflexota bacterium]